MVIALQTTATQKLSIFLTKARAIANKKRTDNKNKAKKIKNNNCTKSNREKSNTAIAI